VIQKKGSTFINHSEMAISPDEWSENNLLDDIWPAISLISLERPSDSMEMARSEDHFIRKLIIIESW
jgi:hypothetical protein